MAEDTTSEDLTEMLQAGILGNPKADATMNAEYVKEYGPFELTVKGFVKRRYKDKEKTDDKWVMLFMEDVPGIVLNATRQSQLFTIMGTAQIDQIVSRKIIVAHDPTVSFGGKKVGGIRLERAEDLGGKEQ